MGTGVPSWAEDAKVDRGQGSVRGFKGQRRDKCRGPWKTRRESWGHGTPLEGEVNVGSAGQCGPCGRAGARWVWSGGARGCVARTFTVHATAPRPARHRHLVLLATGVTALPTKPRGARAAACVQVTVAPLALAAWGGGRWDEWPVKGPRVLATPRCPNGLHSRLQPCSGSPQWPGAHSRHWGPPAPGGQRHCPLWGWQLELSAAGPQAHGWQPLQPSKPKCPSCDTGAASGLFAQPSRPKVLYSFKLKAPPLQPRGPTPTARPHPFSPEILPLPGQSYLTAVTVRPCHTRLAQAVPAVWVTGLCPTWGAVAPCRRWDCDNSPSPTTSLLSSCSTSISTCPKRTPNPSLFTTSPTPSSPNYQHLPDHIAVHSLFRPALLPCSPHSARGACSCPTGMPSRTTGQSQSGPWPEGGRA